jgi:arylsulfatase A-like enzyme
MVAINHYADTAALSEPVQYAAGLFITIALGWILTTQEDTRFAKIIKTSVCSTGLAALLLLLFLNLWLGVGSAIKKPAGPNIVLIVIDCLRADHVGCYGYQRPTTPTIDLLAAKGRRFKSAYSNAPWTKPSIATLFSSIYPSVHNVNNIGSVMPDKILTMAEILKDKGYETFFFNGGNGFIRKEFKFDQGFDTYIYRPHKSSNAEDVTRDFLQNMPGLNNARFFAYLHYMDAHLPYTQNSYNYFFTDNRDARFAPGSRNSIFLNTKALRALTFNREISGPERNLLVSHYDGQIRYVDENIKKVLEGLKEYGFLKETVIIITSDHGEEFWEHKNVEHGHTLYNELLQVPLIICGAGIKPSVITAPVALIDLLPTVMEAAGIEADNADCQGRSLLRQGDWEKAIPEIPVFASGTLYGNEKYCLIKDSKKIILNTETNKGKSDFPGYRSRARLELYDLQEDAPESRNMADTLPAASQYKKDLDKFRNMAPLFEEDASVTVIDGHLKKSLESLGYLQ